MNYRWSTHAPEPEAAARLAKEFGISTLLGQCLINRGLARSADVAAFLQPRLKSLADPFLLPDMERAVQRLLLARETGEPMVIFGDYDVDGVTSSALLHEILTRLGWNCACFLPNRLEEGYGLSAEGVSHCLAQRPATLVLAVDCGSTSVQVIGALADRGVDVVVLDHHQPSDPAPSARALVNPHCIPTGLFHELCSAGLAFKLAHALLKRGRQLGWPAASEIDLRDWLDLVALGTIADMVPLRDENRILVSAGLERLNSTARPGLVALKSAAKVAGAVGVYEVGFQLAPRLNASGRLETAMQSLNLLFARDSAEATPLATELDAQNRNRQAIEQRMVEEVLTAVRARFDAGRDFVIVEGRLDWHVGVVGIVASRVVREFHRPTIILGGEGAEWRGSGRSIEGFDLAAALRGCGDLLARHGGHALAAGLSMVPANLDALRARLNDLGRQSLSAESLRRKLRLDAETRPSELTVGAVEELRKLEPVGQGNPAVQLMMRNVVPHGAARRMGKEQQHVKLWVANGPEPLEVVWWNCGDSALPSGPFDLAFAPSINEFNGKRSVQLKLLDWKPASG